MYAGELHPPDPGIGQLDRPEDQSIDRAVISILERRNRKLRARLLEMLDENGKPPDEAA